MKVIVLGGTGFIGRHICEKLVRDGHEVTVPTRKLENARDIWMLPRLQPMRCDVHDAAQLAQAVAGHQVLINLVAILHGSEQAFEHVHVELPRKIAAAAKACGVQRIIHISSLGVGLDAPSAYLRSKARGEQVLRESGLEVRMLRPSVVFGESDRLINVFARLQEMFPLMPLAGSDSVYQPVWVQDVAQAAVKLLAWDYYEKDSTPGNEYAGVSQQSAPIFEFVGDHTLTLRDMVELAGRSIGAQRYIVALPDVLGRLQAWVMEKLPGPTLMSRDNLGSMKVPSTASGQLPGLRQMGIEPGSIYAIAPAYLQPARKLDRYRKHASR